MITMSGSEFKRFYADPAIWVDEAYWDDALVVVDGGTDSPVALTLAADTSLITIDGGYLVNQPAGVPSDLEEAITWWRAKQTTTEFLLRVPNEKVAAVKEALALLGVELVANDAEEPPERKHRNADD